MAWYRLIMGGVAATICGVNALFLKAPTAMWLAAFATASCSSTYNPPGETGTGGAVQVGAAGSVGHGGGGSSGGRGAAGTSGTVIVQPDPGYLWYGGVELNAFTQAQTAASTDDGPYVTVSPNPSPGTFHDLVFDRSGRAWTIPTSGNQILRVPATGLGAGANPAPDLILTSPGLASPQALAFDPAGNLWVVNFAGAGIGIANIVRFDAPGAWSGSMTASPTVTIAPATDPTSMGRFLEGTAIAFDSAGNLWFASASSVLRIDNPGSLTGAVTAAPSVTISTGDTYSSIAFDAQGALWITATLNGYFALRIDGPSALSGVLQPTLAARIALPNAKASFPGGLAFDMDGALWVVTSSRIVKLASPGALVGQVTPTPAVELGLPVSFAPGLASHLVFQPPPTGLPIY
jgi:sugar lactone lactonase YvrE